jgi:hypothetical protein
VASSGDRKGFGACSQPKPGEGAAHFNAVYARLRLLRIQLFKRTVLEQYYSIRLGIFLSALSASKPCDFDNHVYLLPANVKDVLGREHLCFRLHAMLEELDGHRVRIGEESIE